MFGVTKCEPFRFTPQECLVDKAFVRSQKWLYNTNSDFIPGYSTQGIRELRRLGVKTIAVLDAPPDVLRGDTDPEDKSYETIYGPFFSNTRVVYGKSDNNISRALRRQTAEHSPAGVNLGINQQNFLRSRRANRFIQALEKHMGDKIDIEPLDFHEGLLLYAADASHPKWKLRLQALLEVINCGFWSHPTWVLKGKIYGKLKRFESAKPGKYPRLIGDIGVTGSLICGYVAKLCKKWLADFTYSSKHPGLFVASPDQQALKAVFSELDNPSSDSYFVCFSDDSCLTLKCKDGYFKCNLDISSCDASHTGGMFNAMLRSVPAGPMREALKAATKQLQLPFVIRSNDGKRKVILELNDDPSNLYDVFLASGSILTTYINSLASLLIHQSIVRVDYSSVSVDECEAIVKRQALLAGYVVTCERVDKVQQFQFLKHSPTSDHEPFLNFGVMMRVIGHCFGPLPGPGTFKERCRGNDAQLVAGMIHAGDSMLYRVMAEKHKPSNFDPNRAPDSLKMHYSSFRYAPTVTVDDILARYGTWRHRDDLNPMNLDDLTELCSLYASANIGECVRTRLVDQIFLIDYGYAPPTQHTLPSSGVVMWNYDGYSTMGKYSKRMANKYGSYIVSNDQSRISFENGVENALRTQCKAWFNRVTHRSFRSLVARVVA